MINLTGVDLPVMSRLLLDLHLGNTPFLTGSTGVIFHVPGAFGFVRHRPGLALVNLLVAVAALVSVD